jgi:hypothetical protein
MTRHDNLVLKDDPAAIVVPFEIRAWYRNAEKRNDLRF